MATLSKNKSKKLRIFIGLSEVAGYHQNLKKGFRTLGYKCFFINNNPSHFNHGGDDENTLVIIWRYLIRKRHEHQNRNLLFKTFWYVLCQANAFIVFVWALFAFDVFILGFAGTFFKYRELPILKFFGRKVLYIFHGTDSRAPYLNGVYKGRTTDEVIGATKRLKERLVVIEKYADHIISNPSQGHLHSSIFINRDYVSYPMSYGGSYKLSLNNNKEIRIVHAPSNGDVKGTSEIRAIINKLKGEGFDICYIELTGVSNATVLKELMNCDIVIDQLYSDNLLTGISIEAGYSGKPSVMGSYYSDKLRDNYDGEIPFIYCQPGDLEKNLRGLIDNKKLRRSYGIRAEKFVHSNCDPEKVAVNFLKIINNKIPSKWFFDPMKTTYLYGAGLSKNEVADNIKAVVRRGGFEALMISDKEILEEYKKMIKL